MPVTLIQQKPTFIKKVDGPNKLAIAEMFADTLQGEGLYAGTTATFIRMQGCTLKCHWCFHDSTKVVTASGKPKIKDLVPGDAVLTLDSDENIVETTVKEVLKSTVDVSEMMAVYFDGIHDQPVICTKSHPFYVKDRGWVKAGELAETDIVLGPTKREVVSRNMRESNPMEDPKIRGRVVKTQKSLRELGMIKPYERSEKHRKMFSDKMKGDKNPMKDPEIVKKQSLNSFKKQSKLEERVELFLRKSGVSALYTGNNKLAVGNKGNRYRFPDFVVEGKKKLIEVYDTTMQYIYRGQKMLRGVDWRVQTTEHYQKFGYETFYITQEDLKDELSLKQRLFEYVYNGSMVTKIVDELTPRQKAALYGKADVKEVDVYNLSCSPYNTYLIANGKYSHKWVHNCDTLDVWPEGNEYSFDEIFELFESVDLIERLLRGQHLILTGGSPLKQQDACVAFIKEFIARYGFKPFIEVENEAVLMPSDEMIDYVDWWNNSPKLANSKMKEAARVKPAVLQRMGDLENSSFKFVVNSRADWEEIENTFITPGYISVDQIILMPEGQNQLELSKTRELVADIAIEQGVRFSDRLHITIWDKKTGV